MRSDSGFPNTAVNEFSSRVAKSQCSFTVNLVKESILSLKHQLNHCLFRLRGTFSSNRIDENTEDKQVFLWPLWPLQLTQIRSCKFLA